MGTEKYLTEEWRDIRGFAGLYQVSNFGRVRSLGRKVSRRYTSTIILKQYLQPNGYLFVRISKDGKYTNKLVHRLVAEAYLPNPDNLPQVNHKDEDKTNNIVSNLEWVSAKRNSNYGTRNSRIGGLLTNCESTSRRIAQYTKNMELVHVFPSAKEIQRTLCYHNGNIIRVCKGQRPFAYGFIWKYCEQ